MDGAWALQRSPEPLAASRQLPTRPAPSLEPPTSPRTPTAQMRFALDVVAT